MIALQHTYSEEAIHKNFRGAKRVAFNLELLNQQRQRLLHQRDGFHFISSRWKEAKVQLYFETKDKCAYCEASTKVVAHGDVEHYRPKSIYWWLAYCYDNYLVSCAVCNEVHKKDEFPTGVAALPQPALLPTATDAELKALAPWVTPDPLHEKKGKSRTQFFGDLDQEQPMLLNPYLCDPETYFAYEVDEFLQEVSIIPLTSQVAPSVNETVRVYGLNRVELLSLRHFFFSIYDTFRRTLTDEGIKLSTRQENEAAIELMKQPKAPFAGMVRYFDRVLRL
ncbi:HNH endonuclease family protein [Spirosoma pollinicola]|uniref:HNH nuclease domain-containing protein n=1 Tax=Spirosoma pollinicola TaxID=2057025 RepID=A0A2K8Z2F7_9BACT|nr:hypothetical protein [Spirosoma pollinicola]AUD04014.1 hypothetical protein CWM47_20600 [Spirosoma pollinicola]